MSGNLILVCGAAGRTGQSAVETLLSLNKNVRALVHRDDERAQALRERGVDVRVGEYGELDTVRAALNDVSAAYFVYPIKPGLIEFAANFAQAAREAGVKSIVSMSQAPASRHAKSHASRNHWSAERVFDWAARPVQDGEPFESGVVGSSMAITHIRPTFFAEWLIYPQWRDDIWKNKKIEFPFGNVRHAPIASEDQGRVIGHILANPAPHAGKTYNLYGPAELSYDEIAVIMSEVLGSKISYAPLSINEFKHKLERLSAPPFLIQHIGEAAQNFLDGVFSGTNDIIETITGIPPMSVREFISRNRQLFV